MKVVRVCVASCITDRLPPLFAFSHPNSLVLQGNTYPYRPASALSFIPYSNFGRSIPSQAVVNNNVLEFRSSMFVRRVESRAGVYTCLERKLLFAMTSR